MSEKTILFGPEQSDAILDLLQSIFVTEIISPSPKLSFFFGWMSDVEIINNEAFIPGSGKLENYYKDL